MFEMEETAAEVNKTKCLVESDACVVASEEGLNDADCFQLRKEIWYEKVNLYSRDKKPPIG